MKVIVALKRFLNGEISTSKLQKKGMKVGKNFHRGARCFIDPTFAFLITIGDNVIMSIGVTLLAHDASVAKVTNGFTRIGRITIGNNVFIGANATILPNVSIGDNCIIGSGAVVTKDIPKNSVVAGNPAKIVETIEELTIKHKQLLLSTSVFDDEITRNISNKNIQKQVYDACSNKISYIK